MYKTAIMTGSKFIQLKYDNFVLETFLNVFTKLQANNTTGRVIYDFHKANLKIVNEKVLKQAVPS